jgi:hypothetical protein
MNKIINERVNFIAHLGIEDPGGNSNLITCWRECGDHNRAKSHDAQSSIAEDLWVHFVFVAMFGDESLG